MAFKRKRLYAPRRNAPKRRRFTRRRRSASTKSYSTRSERASTAFKFRGRKLPKKAWRRTLYRSTLVDRHYKSINSTLTTVATPPAITDCTAVIIEAFPIVQPFWKRDPAINQNLQLADGVAAVIQIPNWGIIGNPDPRSCIIRGGRYYINVNCQSTNDPCNVRIQLAFAKQQRLSAAGAAGNTLQDYITSVLATTPKPLTWTVNQQWDYQEYFHPPVLDRVVRLLPGEDMSIVKSIKPTMIDCSVHRDQGGWYPYWFVYASQSATNIAGDPLVGVVTGYNISFAINGET